MLQSNARLEQQAVDLGKLLDEHRGAEVVVMDMRSLNFWTDFFVIATVTSNTHLMGMERHVKDFAQENGLEILRRSRKLERGLGLNFMEQSSTEHTYEWRLLELGGMVVHLMSAKTRSFFELERLWSAAPLIYESPGGSVPPSHSSKSS
jgi:ribosome-associated protein